MNMLPQSIKLVSRLFLIVLSIVFITLLVCRRAAPANPLEIYHLYDCQLPCWIGIIPGKTTIGAAKKLIESAYSVSDFEYSLDHNPYWDIDYFTVTRRKDNFSLDVSFNNDTEGASNQTEATVVSQIEITINLKDQPTLFDWGMEFGQPQALGITWGNHSASPNVLYYNRNVRLTLDLGYDNFVVDGVNIPVYMLDIYEQLAKAYPLNGFQRVRWQGWATNYENQLLASMLP